jgi:hypothetical protein
LIVTHPQDANTRTPVIFVVGWLSCDSVEAPPGTTDATQLVGGMAPLVTETAQVKGYVVDGGWIKTWYEHMLEIERRRLTLAGHGAPELNTLMKRVEEFYSGYLLDRLPAREIFARRPEFKSLCKGDPEYQYGRPVPFDDRIAQRIAQWFERHR